MIYIAKLIYDEHKETIFTLLDSLLLKNCPFTIISTLGYLYGALSRTFNETNEVISVDKDELEQYLLHMQKAIYHLEHFAATQKDPNPYCKYLTVLKTNQKHFTEILQ